MLGILFQKHFLHNLYIVAKNFVCINYTVTVKFDMYMYTNTSMAAPRMMSFDGCCPVGLSLLMVILSRVIYAS